MKGSDAVTLGALGLAGLAIFRNTNTAQPQPGTVPGAVVPTLNPFAYLENLVTPLAQSIVGGFDVWSMPYAIVDGAHWYSPGSAFVGTDWFAGDPNTTTTPFLSVPYTDIIPDWFPFLGGF